MTMLWFLLGFFIGVFFTGLLAHIVFNIDS